MWLGSDNREHEERERLRLIRLRAAADHAQRATSTWTAQGARYVQRDRQRPYVPHHAAEEVWVADDRPRYGLAKGGEGGGKSVAGIIKDLERLRRGMSGILVSPDFEHFKRSLWREFAAWCPWDAVIPEQRYRGRPGWEPTRPFALTFQPPRGGLATLLCGGIEDPSAWEGPNVHFAHFDEPRRHRTPAALKVLDGRCRLDGSHGEPPQLWLTSTPAMHWLYDYFSDPRPDHPFPAFRADARVIDLLTVDNERAGHLAEGYTAQRRQSLTEAEARVLLEAAWEDIDVADRFLSSMLWWDTTTTELPPLDDQTPVVLAADGATDDDTFAVVAVSAWPDSKAAVRYARAWVPDEAPLDFAPIEQELRDLCRRFRVIQIAYDRTQLHDMMTRLMRDGVTWTEPFSQQGPRLEADKMLQDAIRAGRIVHDGDTVLRAHLANADRKRESDDRLRIVKRRKDLKIDLAVALAMAYHRLMTDFGGGA
jgi:hypothetical protein